MFDALLKILDRILDYWKHASQFDSRFLDQFLEPLFLETEAVAHNYLTFFHVLQGILWASADWAVSIATLKEMREELQVKRRELAAKSFAALSSLPEASDEGGATLQRETREFFLAIHTMFLGPIFEPEERSQFPSLTEILEKEERARNERNSQTASGVIVQLMEFIAYQEDHLYADGASDSRREELRRYAKKAATDIASRWYNAVFAYTRTRLIYQAPPVLLRDHATLRARSVTRGHWLRRRFSFIVRSMRFKKPSS